MDWQDTVWIDVVQRHVNDLADAVLVYLVHAKRSDILILEDLLLPLVNVTQSDVDNPVGFEDRKNPGKGGDG